jgi:hypothetical protein
LKDSLNPMAVIKFDDVASYKLRERTKAGYIYIVIVDRLTITLFWLLMEEMVLKSREGLFSKLHGYLMRSLNSN